MSPSARTKVSAENRKRRAKLRAAIRRYTEARIANAEKGGGDPASYSEIEDELTAALKNLNHQIKEVLP